MTDRESGDIAGAARLAEGIVHLEWPYAARTPPMGAAGFLRALWGSTPPGFIQVWELAGRRSAYYATPEAVHVNGDRDVFTAVGTTAARHGASHRARAKQIAAIAGLWLDLDIGPGACPTRTHALGLANRHTRPTLTVDSGYGVHAWYLFHTPWRFVNLAEQADAATLARQFVALHQASGAERGWRVDSVGDLARVMRLPGTLNAKQPDSPQAVAMIEAEGPRYERATLAALCAAAVPPPPVATARSDLDVQLGALTPLSDEHVAVLRANDPLLDATWRHDRPDMPLATASEYDLSLASQMAHADPDASDDAIAGLLIAHRMAHDPSDPKIHRRKYLTDTVARARASALAAAEARTATAAERKAADDKQDEKIAAALRMGGLA